MNKIFISGGQSADTLWYSVDRKAYCKHLLTKDTITKEDYKKVATKVVEDAIKDNRIEICVSFAYQKKELIEDVAEECEFFVKDYPWIVCKNMKLKTKKFISYIEQFSKPNTFKIVSKTDVDNVCNKVNNNTYFIKCNLNNHKVTMIITDASHKMSTYSITSIDGKECSSDYQDIAINDIDSHNTFLTFAYYLKKAE